MSSVATDSVPDVTVTTDGADQSVTNTGTCSDNAGNSAVPATFSNIDLDATAPSASTTLDRGADHNGWYNAPVGHTTSGTDATSGIATCSSGSYSGPDGTGLSVSGDVLGQRRQQLRAGGLGGVQVRQHRPERHHRARRGADHNGWYNAPVGYTTSGTDATSGIDDCSSGSYSGPDGTGLSVSGTCTDNAGNSSGPAALGGVQVRQHRSGGDDDTRPCPRSQRLVQRRGRVQRPAAPMRPRGSTHRAAPRAPIRARTERTAR